MPADRLRRRGPSPARPARRRGRRGRSPGPHVRRVVPAEQRVLPARLGGEGRHQHRARHGATSPPSAGALGERPRRREPGGYRLGGPGERSANPAETPTRGRRVVPPGWADRPRGSPGHARLGEHPPNPPDPQPVRAAGGVPRTQGEPVLDDLTPPFKPPSGRTPAELLHAARARGRRLRTRRRAVASGALVLAVLVAVPLASSALSGSPRTTRVLTPAD